MPFETTLNLLSGIFMLAAVIAPLYFMLRVGNPTIRALSGFLSAFLLLHGIYHLASVYGGVLSEWVGDVVFEPLSWLVLVIFAILYSKRLG